MNFSASASATQVSIARAETPASNIRPRLDHALSRGALPLSGKFTQGRFTADHRHSQSA